MNAKPHVPPTYGSSWEPRNLAHVEERPPIAPDLGGVGLVYPGKRHVFSGPPESAKTIVAYICALEVVRQGGTVLLVDFEMGQWDARDRLRELSATDEELEQVLYVEPEEPATEQVVVELINRWSPTLVIIDAAAGAFDLQGLDDNKRGDVERFAGVYVRSFFVCGVATIVLDHVVKDPKSRGGFVIGSERKVGGADVHLGFEVDKPLHRGGRGFYRIVTHKDRLGYLPRPTAAELELVSDPEMHAITWKLTEPTGADKASDWRPTVLMERVSRFLERQVEPVSRNVIDAARLGTAEYVRQAIDFLILDDFVCEERGARRARLVSSVRPYRELHFQPSTTLDFVGTSSAEFVGDFVGSEPHSSAESDFVGTSSALRRSSEREFVGPLTGDDALADEVDAVDSDGVSDAVSGDEEGGHDIPF